LHEAGIDLLPLAVRQTTLLRPMVFGISAPEIPDCGIGGRSKKREKEGFFCLERRFSG
jgi:hypothetical protein